jgi:hypothetical protein
VAYHSIVRNRDYRPLSWRPADPNGIVFRSRSRSTVST